MIKGIDVSHHNGTIDFSALIQNHPEIRFCIAKATQGTSFVDDKFKRNINQAFNHSLLRGAYHYVVGNRDPYAQADHFCNVVEQDADYDTLLALDIEDHTITSLPYKEVSDMTLIMVSKIYERLHTYPLIYCSRAFMHPETFSVVGKLCGGWIAAWSDKTPARRDLNTSIWQYSSTGRLTGIKGNVDMNKAFISPENWKKIADPYGYRAAVDE